MKVGIFLSGVGSNARAILEGAGKKYTVSFLFSDNINSSAAALGTEFNIPVILLSIESFFKHCNLFMKDINHRRTYDTKIFEMIKSYKVDCIALAGYKWIVTDYIWSNYITFNVHPGDLLKENKGKRIFAGNSAIRKAIMNKEKYVRSTVHTVNGGIDTGRILLQSAPISLMYPEGWENTPIPELEKLNRQRIKLWGDHVIYPLALNLWADGVFEKDYIFRLENNGEVQEDNDNN